MRIKYFLPEIILILSTVFLFLTYTTAISADQTSGSITIGASVISSKNFTCALSRQQLKTLNAIQLNDVCDYDNTIQYSKQITNMVDKSGATIIKNIITLTYD